MLGAKAHRVGFQRQDRAVGGADLVLVPGPFGQAGQKDLPDAGRSARAHRVAPAVPMVEVANDRNAGGVRCPDGEANAVRAFVPDGVGAEQAP